MPEIIHRTLREANVARDIEWTAGTLKDYTWRAAELVGEVGELIEALIHPLTAAMDHGGSADLAVAHEAADVVICIDLTGLTLELDPIPPNYAAGRFPYSVPIFAAELAYTAGKLSNVLKKLERERRGWPGSRATKEDADIWLKKLAGMVGLLATYQGFSMLETVEEVFNATSAKVGLSTVLHYRPTTE